VKSRAGKELKRQGKTGWNMLGMLSCVWIIFLLPKTCLTTSPGDC
jgi:hypothetical protein